MSLQHSESAKIAMIIAFLTIKKNIKIRTLPIAICMIMTQLLFAYSQQNNFQDNLIYLLKNKNLTIKTQPRSDSQLNMDAPEAVNKNTSENEIHAKGGFSDGGGNSVANTFFDFYENKDSVEVTIEQLIKLDPEFEQLLNQIEYAIPALNTFEGDSLKKYMLESIKLKKIFLEKKEIQSEGCKNQSLVATKDQTIVGCQSDLEIRMNIHWLATTDSKNRLGFFLHEFVLGWARKHKSELKKYDLELKVRNFVRATFNSLENNAMNQNLASEFMQIFNTRAYSPKNLAATRNLITKSQEAQRIICEKSSDSIEDLFRSEYQNSFLVSEIPSFIQNLFSGRSYFKLGSTDSNYIQSYNEYCEKYWINKPSLDRKPNLSLLTNKCLEDVEKIAIKYLDDLSRFKKLEQQGEITKSDSQYLLNAKSNLAKMIALNCSAYKGLQLEKQLFMTEEKGRRLMRESFFEALYYYRYKLKESGVIVKF